MSENLGKKKFDGIEIPEELAGTVSLGLRRGRRNRLLRQSLSGLAAAVALVFLTANVPPLYARASEVPLLAPLVRVMRVGSGGGQVTGAEGHVQTGPDRVRIDFPGGVPAFSAARRELPRRVTLRLHGLAEGKTLELTEALLAQEGVAEAYALSVTDPAEQGAVFHLKPGWDCAAVQYEDALELQFSRSEAGETAAGYVLCSEPLSPGRELAELTESLLWEGATQLRTAPGEYRAVLGEYRTEERAQAARQAVLENIGVNWKVLPIPAETGETKSGGNP